MLAFDTLLSILVLATASAAAPRSASCPAGHGWMNNGIRPSGEFSCLHHSVVESDAPADRELRGRLYCGPNETPIVINERAVACGKEHR